MMNEHRARSVSGGKRPLYLSRFVPELALLDTDEERRIVLRQFWRERWGRWGFLLYCLWALAVAAGLFFIVVIVGLLLMELLHTWGFRPWRWVGQFFLQIAGWLCSLAAGVSITYLTRHRLRKYCRQRLAAKGVPICIACGYDLRGQVDPRCPECGTAFDPVLIKPPGDPPTA